MITLTSIMLTTVEKAITCLVFFFVCFKIVRFALRHYVGYYTRESVTASHMSTQDTHTSGEFVCMSKYKEMYRDIMRNRPR